MKVSWNEETDFAPVIPRAGNRAARFLLPSLQDVIFMALFVAVIGLGPRLLNVDGDLGRHLTIGGYILDSASIPTTDLFSHTMDGAPLTPHEWLAQVSYAMAYRLAGLDGVVILCALLIAGTFTLVYRQCLERSGQILLSLGFTLLAAAAASLHWLARPHLFTILIVVLWVEVLERIRIGRTRRWWLLPVIMLAWANLHGAFLAGFAIWVVYLSGELLERGVRGVLGEAGRQSRLLLAGGLAALVTSLVNPAGWRLWETSLDFLRSGYLVGHTAEYMAPDFHLKSTWPFLGMIILSLLSFGSSRKRLSATLLLLVVSWMAMALISTRNIPIYAVLAAPVLALAFSQVSEETGKVGNFSRLQARLALVEQALSGHLWPVIVVFLIAISLINGVSLDLTRRGNRFDPQVFPVAAVDWLENQPDLGPVFNYFPWGGYLLYRTWPEQRVFIDGQTDFYGEQLTRQYEQVITLRPGWETVLQSYGVQWVIMPPGGSLVDALETNPQWRVVYEDGTAVILAYED